MSKGIRITLIVVVVLVLLGATALLAPRLFNPPVKGIPKGWSTVVGSPDDWTSQSGKIHGHAIQGESMLLSDETFGDVTLSANATSTNREASFVIRALDGNNCYLVIFVPYGTPRNPSDGWIELIKRQSGNDMTIASYKGRVMSTLGHTAKITTIAKGPWIEVKLNDVTVIRVKDITHTSGFIGLRIYGHGDQPCDATYSYLRFD